MARQLLGEILRDQGKVAPEQLEQALRRQHETHEILGHILFDMGAVSEGDLQEAWGIQLGREYIDLHQTLLSSELIRKLSAELARRYCALPVRREGDMVVVAMANPLDVRAVCEIARQMQVRVRSAVSSASELESAIGKYYA